MGARACASKAAGAVIDGRFRDLQEQRDLTFPVSQYHQHHCFPSRETPKC